MTAMLMALSLYIFPWQETLRPYIEEVATEFAIDAELIEAMCMVESTWNPEAENGKCIGLMQVSEKWHKDRMEKYDVTDLHDPYGNILVAVDYLEELYERYGNTALVLDKYNGNSHAEEYFKQGRLSTYASNVLNTKTEIEKEKEEMNREQFMRSLNFEVSGHRGSVSDKDVSISITLTHGNAENGRRGISFTFRNGTANLVSETGYVRFAQFKNRIIFDSADIRTGATLTNSKEAIKAGNETRYAKFSREGIAEKYIAWEGNYELKYDTLYEYYYIEREEI